MRNSIHVSRLVAFAISALFVAGPVFAKDHDGNGQGRGHGQKAEAKAEKHGGGKREREEVRMGGYFNDQHREVVREYYTRSYRDAGRCPPGLAKKHNGCLPPGQARKLAVGQPVPTGVVLYPVPQPVVTRLPPAPYGYRYARVLNDVVLVQSSNRLVVDIVIALP
jgi:Ni/Co efflux regulator RcnB